MNTTHNLVKIEGFMNNSKTKQMAINELNKMGCWEIKTLKDAENELQIYFSTDSLEYGLISDLSMNLPELDFSLISYDSSLGYAKKHKYKCIHKISDKTIGFGQDLEWELHERSLREKTDFFDLLLNEIDKFGTEESNIPKVGDKIKILEKICPDIELLQWYDSLSNKNLIVNHIDLLSDGIWIDNCEYRIDLNEIEIIR